MYPNDVDFVDGHFEGIMLNQEQQVYRILELLPEFVMSPTMRYNTILFQADFQLLNDDPRQDQQQTVNCKDVLSEIKSFKFSCLNLKHYSY